MPGTGAGHADPMEASGVPEPMAELLRAEVRRFVTECGTRRALPTEVRIGVPAGHRITLPADPTYDAALRSDLLTRAVDRLADPAGLTVWLTRGGFTTAGDVDLAWLAAADAAFGRHAVARVPFFAVTRHGWLEVRTAEARTWRRVRPLRPPPA